MADARDSMLLSKSGRLGSESVTGGIPAFFKAKGKDIDEFSAALLTGPI